MKWVGWYHFTSFTGMFDLFLFSIEKKGCLDGFNWLVLG